MVTSHLCIIRILNKTFTFAYSSKKKKITARLGPKISIRPVVAIYRGHLYMCSISKIVQVIHSVYAKGGGPRVVVSTAAFYARVRGSVPGLGGLKETKLFLPHPRVKVSIVGSLRDREVACSASDRQNFESCVWRTVSSQSSHHPQEVLLAQFSQYVHKGGLKPDSFHLYMPSFMFLTQSARFFWLTTKLHTHTCKYE